MIGVELKDKLRKQADRLWIVAVISKWGRYCESCGMPAITAHHFIPRNLSANLHWDLDNGVPICRKCHFFHHHRADPSIHILIRDKRGEKWWRRLQKKREKHITITSRYLKDVIKRLSK